MGGKGDSFARWTRPRFGGFVRRAVSLGLHTLRPLALLSEAPRARRASRRTQGIDKEKQGKRH